MANRHADGFSAAGCRNMPAPPALIIQAAAGRIALCRQELIK